jgi:hypothetical protein
MLAVLRFLGRGLKGGLVVEVGRETTAVLAGTAPPTPGESVAESRCAGSRSAVAMLCELLERERALS